MFGMISGSMVGGWACDVVRHVSISDVNLRLCDLRECGFELQQTLYPTPYFLLRLYLQLRIIIIDHDTDDKLS